MCWSTRTLRVRTTRFCSAALARFEGSGGGGWIQGPFWRVYDAGIYEPVVVYDLVSVIMSAWGHEMRVYVVVANDMHHSW